jgi:hypothetical protein
MLARAAIEIATLTSKKLSANSGSGTGPSPLRGHAIGPRHARANKASSQRQGLCRGGARSDRCLRIKAPGPGRPVLCRRGDFRYPCPAAGRVLLSLQWTVLALQLNARYHLGAEAAGLFGIAGVVGIATEDTWSTNSELLAFASPHRSTPRRLRAKPALISPRPRRRCRASSSILTAHQAEG